MPTQSRYLPFTLLAATLLLGGCSTLEMKGTPFYTGEYESIVHGADERRVNVWPLAYYREPALSILWPVFEHTEEHVAVRPIFSAYGSTNAYWEYNLIWPLCQADTQGRDYRIFPYYWGKGKRAGNIAQDYQVLFPFLWHFEDETFALFPLWITDRDGWKDGRFTERDDWLAWPLAHRHSGARENAWHAGLFGRYRYLDRGESYTGYPWPLFFSWSDKEKHGCFTPFYAFETSDQAGVRDGWDALPLLLSWRRRQGDSQDLTAALGLYHQSQRGTDRSGWLLPLCAYDTRDRLLLTPLIGWDKPDPQNPDGYWYPFTPLAGVLTGAHRGGWLFPLFHHTASVSNDTFDTNFLLLGYADHSRHQWKEVTSDNRSYGVFPLVSHSLYASSTSSLKEKTLTGSTNRFDRLLLLSYSEERQTTRRSLTSEKRTEDDYHMTSSASGVFPLWNFESRTKSSPDGSLLSSTDEFALLLALYDTKLNTVAANGNMPALDYTRRRILWRVWHYERRNGDASMDLFPFITRDSHADGFRKTAFLWRFYRYEKSRDGKTSLDLFFLPLIRD